MNFRKFLLFFVLFECYANVLQALYCNSVHHVHGDFNDNILKEPGRQKRYLIHWGGGWDKKLLTYRLQNYPHDFSSKIRQNNPLPGTRKQVRNAIKKAFREWAKVSALRFKETRKEPDINVKFDADMFANDTKPWESIRYNRYADVEYPINGGDITLDIKEPWTINAKCQGLDLFQIMVNLIGHSLGLDNSSDEKAVMYPRYVCKKKFKLGGDDIKGIRYLYGKK